MCGSTQGIGRAAAEALARAGAEITLLARNADALAAVAAGLDHSAGQRHDRLVADFGQPGQVEAVVGDAVRRGAAWDILVNNTGGPPGGRAIDADADEFERAFGAHLLNSHALVRLLAPGMRQRRFGRVINIISTSVKAPIPGLGVSNTIRGAVASWAKTLAAELGPDGITVNNVLPGFTETARLAQLFESKATKAGRTIEDIRTETIATIPVGRLGRADEIAAAVVFLAAPIAGYINGINLPVDGGRLPTL